jgi:hypothetical protein
MAVFHAEKRVPLRSIKTVLIESLPDTLDKNELVKNHCGKILKIVTTKIIGKINAQATILYRPGWLFSSEFFFSGKKRIKYNVPVRVPRYAALEPVNKMAIKKIKVIHA